MGINLKDRDLSGVEPTGDQRPKIKVEGDFLVKVEVVKIQESKRFRATYYVVEFEILESDVEEIKAGRQYAWTNDLELKFGETEIGLGNALNFLMAAMGAEQDTLTGNHILESAAEDQPLTGSEVRLHTSPRVSDGGNHYCVHSWANADS